MTEATRLIFLGAPGSGKGTQAQVLAEFLGVPHISTGEMLRQAIGEGTPLGQEAQGYVDRGELVPDELILNLIRERLGHREARQGWILDGFPRNTAQAAFLDGLLEEVNQSCDLAINLEVPDAAIVQRLLLRGRQDDTEETIRRRLQVYREQTEPLLGYYERQGKLHSLDGDRLPGEVTQSLQQLLKAGGGGE